MKTCHYAILGLLVVIGDTSILAEDKVVIPLEERRQYLLTHEFCEKYGEFWYKYKKSDDEVKYKEIKEMLPFCGYVFISNIDKTIRPNIHCCVATNYGLCSFTLSPKNNIGIMALSNKGINELINDNTVIESVHVNARLSLTPVEIPPLPLRWEVYQGRKKSQDHVNTNSSLTSTATTNKAVRLSTEILPFPSVTPPAPIVKEVSMLKLPLWSWLAAVGILLAGGGAFFFLRRKIGDR